MWSKRVSLNFVSWSPGHIAAYVSGRGFNPWLFTGFYGHPDHSNRYQSWNFFKRINDMFKGPWLWVRDFNEIVGHEESRGGNIRSVAAMDSFKEVIHECNLYDFCDCKNELTWCWKYSNGVIMERLDRSLCNCEWMIAFPSSYVRIPKWWCSDHRAVETENFYWKKNNRGRNKRKNRFQFVFER